MPNPKTILAVDPGSRNLGFAVLRAGRILASGTHRFPKLVWPVQRRQLDELFSLWRDAFRPEDVVLEATPGRFGKGLEAVWKLAGRIEDLARSSGIPVTRYAAQTARKAFLGSGWASKAEAALYVCERFPDLRIYLRQDRRWKEKHFLNMFDAILLALHHETRLAAAAASHRPPAASR